MTDLNCIPLWLGLKMSYFFVWQSSKQSADHRTNQEGRGQMKAGRGVSPKYVEYEVGDEKIG